MKFLEMLLNPPKVSLIAINSCDTKSFVFKVEEFGNVWRTISSSGEGNTFVLLPKGKIQGMGTLENGNLIKTNDYWLTLILMQFS